jgi:hypothetical protein
MSTDSRISVYSKQRRLLRVKRLLEKLNTQEKEDHTEDDPNAFSLHPVAHDPCPDLAARKRSQAAGRIKHQLIFAMEA